MRLCHEEDIHHSYILDPVAVAGSQGDSPFLAEFPGMTQEVREFHARMRMKWSILEDYEDDDTVVWSILGRFIVLLVSLRT